MKKEKEMEVSKIHFFVLGLLIGFVIMLFVGPLLLNVTGVNTKLCEKGQLRELEVKQGEWCVDHANICLVRMGCNRLTVNSWVCDGEVE